MQQKYLPYPQKLTINSLFCRVVALQSSGSTVEENSQIIASLLPEFVLTVILCLV